MLTISYLVAKSAFQRKKSLGAHYRIDENKNESFDESVHFEVTL
jgi:aspartate oxidase